MGLVLELKRRNVIRMVALYAVAAWLIMQVAEVVVTLAALPDWSGQIVLVLLVIGFPIALVVSWFYEITPEGLSLEKDVDRAESITHVTGRRMDFVVIALLSAAVILFSWHTWWPSDPSDKSIAVMPFVNMSDDSGNEYFSDGISEEILNLLARIPQLTVISRSSSFSFKDKDLDTPTIAEQLNVPHVLEGSVRREGNRVRITAQLIDARSDSHLWSETYDRELGSVFAIQDEIAAAVVDALKITLLDEAAENLQVHATDNIEAYTQYLLALKDVDQYTFKSLTSAVNHLQTSIDLDPDYAPAYSLLARAYGRMAITGAMGRDEGIRDARTAVTRALELSPNSSEALSVLGMVELSDGNDEVAEKLFLKAIENGPNDALALRYYATYLSSQARLEESIEVLRQVILRDPLSPDAHSYLAGDLRVLQRFDEAMDVAHRLQEIDPQNPYGLAMSADINVSQGNWAAAIQQRKRGTTVDPDDPELAMITGYLYLTVGLPNEAVQWLDRAVEIDPDNPVSLSYTLYLKWIVHGNDQDTRRQARTLLEDNIENRRDSRWIAAYILLDDAGRTRDYTTLLEILDNLHPNLFDEPPVNVTDDLSMTNLVGRALVESGDIERGFRLLSLWSDEIEESQSVYGIRRGSIEIDLLRGNKEAALEKLEQRESRKYDTEISPWFYTRDRLWQTIADEPQVVELVERLNQHAAEQRAILQAMSEDASGE